MYTDDIRERLFVEVYNAGKLEEKLKGVLHECREDLVLVYRLSGYDEHSKRDCDLVTEEQMARWGVEAETLKRDAWENTMAKRPPIMIDLQDASYLCFKENHLENDNPVPLGISPLLDMFVITNRMNNNGAIYMFNDETMQKIANKIGGNLIILPSSVHETIVYSEEHGMDIRRAKDMVENVNETTLRDAEFLSGEIYRYDKDNHTLSKVQVPEHEEILMPDKVSMKRVYAYLMQKRHISREVLSFFARQGTLYESVGHHNAVFVGVDKEGNPRHIHKKGTCSDGRNFRMNEDGSDSSYGFGYAGAGNKLYVFEAPIDFLSFLTLYPVNWQENSYIVLNGVSEHAMMQMLKDYPNLDTVVLCLDHDPAGIEACGRLSEILVQNGYRQIKNLKSSCKDWNEDLKLLHGEEVIPAQEHPKILECDAWIEILKQVTDSVDIKYATKENVCRYYQDIYNALKKGNGKEHLEDAFDGGGMLLTGVLVRCMEKAGRELGRETSANEILDNLHKRYRPHKDKGNYNTRLRNMQKAFEEVMEVFDKKDLSLKENKEEFVKKCMSLTMECIKAHIFVATEYEEPIQRKEMRMECSQS